jgi:hypothetical protein
VIAFGEASNKPKMLLVAPMSGHYATLLRGTVAAFLDTHQVFITDWTDAKEVPLSAGRFDLDDYIDYCVAMFERRAQKGLSDFNRLCFFRPKGSWRMRWRGTRVVVTNIDVSRPDIRAT